MVSHFVLRVEKGDDGCLVEGKLELVRFGKVSCLDHDGAGGQEIVYLPVFELGGVKLVKNVLSTLKFRWDNASWNFLVRPLTTGEDLNREFDSVDDVGPVWSVLEFLDHLL
jgi:hypothetical protein